MPWQQTYHGLISGQQGGPAAAAARAALRLLAWPYGGAVWLRNAYYDHWPGASRHVGVPVVSVGNLTTGGTGKTPLVAWLARWFQQRGTPVAILSRGYAARHGQPNDEAQELAALLPEVPHFQHPDRCAAAQQALARLPRPVLVLDDGFQHRRLARDLDIVLLDALVPFGHGYLLPRGLLREPPSSLGRADVVGLSRSEAVSREQREAIWRRVQALAPHALWIELVHQPRQWWACDGRTLPLETLQGAPVAAFCGIGNPAGFWQTLARCGVNLVDQHAFPDHCSYGPPERETLQRWAARTSATHLVCTRKDLVKLAVPELAGKPLWALHIDVEVVNGGAELEARLATVAAGITNVQPHHGRQGTTSRL